MAQQVSLVKVPEEKAGELPPPDDTTILQEYHVHCKVCADYLERRRP